jgi:hypothetical protein
VTTDTGLLVKCTGLFDIGLGCLPLTHFVPSFCLLGVLVPRLETVRHCGLTVLHITLPSQIDVVTMENANLRDHNSFRSSPYHATDCMCME